ncbi:hypothetical protein BDN72DRAFT_907127 [Pluteus cervinus]|uniref:Uncharacterized protein n=1 Tax=Pluteus cervinus TaxID=181527 RepID=A0ACD2ZXE4_9AGAR|nr:hypothetical protein BDN72DRAFT_907127 [Pluteus cervinus]
MPVNLNFRDLYPDEIEQPQPEADNDMGMDIDDEMGRNTGMDIDSIMQGTQDRGADNRQRGTQDKEADNEQEGTQSKQANNGPVAEVAILSQNGIYVISELASFSRLLNVPPDSMTRPCLEAYLAAAAVLSPTSQDLLEESSTSLVTLANRCKISERSHATAFFNYAMSVIIFRLSIQNAMAKDPTTYSTRSKVLIEIAPIAGTSVRNLELYVAEGAKLCLLAGAGSIYLLVLFACCLDKKQLKMLTGDMTARLASLIRCPKKVDDKVHTDDVLGNQLIEDIIPAIAVLRRKFPFTIPTMYQEKTQDLYKIGPGPLNCQDIIASDLLFDSIYYDCFVKGRKLEHWNTALSDIPADVPDEIPAKSTPFIISTNFDPNLDINTKINFSKGPDNLKERQKQTEKERSRAKTYAKRSRNLADFSAKVKEQVKSGHRLSLSDYTHLGFEIIQE